MNSIHLTREYTKIWNCKGYKPLEILDSNGNLIVSGRILYKFGAPYKTIIGGLGGSGILDYSEGIIKEVLKKSKGQVLIYDFQEQPILEKFGFKRYDDWTFIVDISDRDKLWEKLDKKNRNDIRNATRFNIEFEEIKSVEELKKLYSLFREQAKRWNFRIPHQDYFENVWNYMVTKNMAKFFIIKYQNEMISIAQIFVFGNEISMPTWGTSNKAREIRGANNYLIWKILEWGNKCGYKKFNFWGTDPDPNSPLYGIHKFKESFGGELVKVYRYEKNSFIYNLAKSLIR